jgi:hypothetical protein
MRSSWALDRHPGALKKSSVVNKESAEDFFLIVDISIDK